MQTNIFYYKSVSVSILLALATISLLLYPGCSGSRIIRNSEPPVILLSSNSSDLQFLKLHMKNGELYVFTDGVTRISKDSLCGNGKLLNLNREIISEGKFNIPINQIALGETNKIDDPQVGGLGTLTVLSGIVTVLCLTNPKACFGSCPTFYINDGNEYSVQSEGFSSSILPSLEDRDIDALYRINTIDDDIEIQLRNEAYETHVIRSANLLAVPRGQGERVFHTQDSKFFQTKNLREAVEAEGDEGDISEKLCTFDGNERFSKADSTNLATSELIELTFNYPVSDRVGLVIAARQTLLTTFLFYQTLAYMGKDAVSWFAEIERNSEQFKAILENPRAVLGNIEVLVQNLNGEWEKIGEVGETGPIATDIKIVPLGKIVEPRNENSYLKVKLRMTKGLWRIDYVALADLIGEARPLMIPPSTASPQYANNSKVVELLTNPDSVLVTYPGDRYFLNYKLSEEFNNYELFLETQGYYLEWMRNAWMGEENPGKIYQLLFNPAKFYQEIASDFKKVEAEMEETFWSSKYVIP